MNANPRVSVILPVYNASGFLREAVQSILDQRMGDFELLAIDDGSTDDSLKILESFSDPRLRILRNSGNRKLIYTLNRGLDEAKGEFVARMDADDISLADRFSLQLEYLAAHPEVAAVGSNAVRIDDKGTRGGVIRKPSGLSASAFAWRPTPLIHPTVMMRGKLAKEFRYDDSSLHCEDYDLWIRMLKAGHKIANLAEPLLLYRVHEGAVTSLHRDLQLRESHAAFVRGFPRQHLSFEEYEDLVGVANRLSLFRRFQIFRELSGGEPFFGNFVLDSLRRLLRGLGVGGAR